MPSLVVPMKLARLVALALSHAFGVIGGSVGLNGLIKGNQSKSRLRRSLPQGVTVDINTNGIRRPCPSLFLLFLHPFIRLRTSPFQMSTILAWSSRPCVPSSRSSLLPFFLLTLYYPGKRPTDRAPLSTRTLPAQSIALGFCSAKITAFVQGVQLPASVVGTAQQALGATSIYKHMNYLRLVAIIPWFTLLFSSIASVVLFMAARRRTTETPFEETMQETTLEKEDVKISEA
ncbi:hypothetical protein EW146_g5605 [Bondarzewia mesenterica]|uniref:Uncharacterized protein n=1 Tax=Bondarzewia mesenterica TaxID=1095465 RepID=A0A4S4LQZ9_9AGAM|nr:hypothetical protein EW146_g5605 [Bondarzewia mesenterica]